MQEFEFHNYFVPCLKSFCEIFVVDQELKIPCSSQNLKAHLLSSSLNSVLIQLNIIYILILGVRILSQCYFYVYACISQLGCSLHVFQLMFSYLLCPCCLSSHVIFPHTIAIAILSLSSYVFFLLSIYCPWRFVPRTVCVSCLV